MMGLNSCQGISEVSGYYFYGLVSEVSGLIASVWRTSTSEQILTWKRYPEPSAF